MLNDILDQDHEKSLLEQWNTIKPCQCRSIVSATINSCKYDEQAILFLLRLCKRPYLATLALEKAGSDSQALIEGILSQVLIYEPTRNVPDQQYRMDRVMELCESALPYATHGGLLYSEILLREVGNWQGVSPSIWNRRIKALFGTQDLGALARIADSDLELAYENWKTLMQSTDHHDSMISVHIASSLYRLGHRHNLFAALPSSVQTASIDIPPALSKWILRARQLFLPPKGAKIFKATFLRTVKAVVDALAQRSPDLLEMTIMATEILPNVDVRSFEEWGQEAATAVDKLKEKLLEPDIPPVIMANAFCVLRMGTTIREPDIPANFIVLFEPIVRALLMQTRPFSTNEMINSWHFVKAVVELLPTGSEESVPKELVTHCLQVVLTTTFDLCRPANLDAKNRLGLEWALLLLRALGKRMAIASDEGGYLVDIFCNEVRDLGFPRWWTINLSNPQKPRNCAKLRCCPHHAEFGRQQVCTDLSRLFVDFSSQIKELATCADVAKLQAQANAQRDMAAPERSWEVCRFGQVPAHLEELYKEKEKFNKLTRVLKSTETDLADLEQTHQTIKANFSRAREGQAYFLQRSQDLGTALQDLHLERGLLQEQLSTTLKEMERDRENDRCEADKVIRGLRDHIEDLELADHGADLFRQEQAEHERTVQEHLETQVQWLREQLDAKDKEFREAHGKEIKAMRDNFEVESTAVIEQVGTQTTPLPET